MPNPFEPDPDDQILEGLEQDPEDKPDDDGPPTFIKDWSVYTELSPLTGKPFASDPILICPECGRGYRPSTGHVCKCI